MTIRPYRESDIPALHWLSERTPPAGQVAYEPQPRDESIDHIPERYLAFWVAVHSDGTREGIAGCVGMIDPTTDTEVSIPAELQSPSRTVRLRIMRVAPEVQRQGIGRRLFEAAEAWAVEQRFERLILETTPQQAAAVALYAAVGCREIGRSMIGTYELVWMAKSLARSDQGFLRPCIGFPR